jgi:ribosomal protein L29
MKTTDELKALRGKGRAALLKEVSEAETNLRDFAFQTASNQRKDVREIRETKKRLARLRTVLATMTNA